MSLIGVEKPFLTIGVVQIAIPTSLFDHPCLILGTDYILSLPNTFLVCYVQRFSSFDWFGFCGSFLELCESSNKISVKYTGPCLIVYPAIHNHKHISRIFYLLGSVLDLER